MVDVSSQNNSVSINVSSSGNSASINATPDMAMYYSEKSKEWAISNRIVDGVDYSSKYYANKAKESAENASNFENATRQTYNAFLESSANANLELEATKDKALIEIENNRVSAVDNLNTIKNEAVDSINSTKTTILKDIEFVADGEKQEIEDLADLIKENAEEIASRTSFAMFDTILKDHILTYEESKGLALQGTYVYKTAIAGERFGYPDFYNKVIEEYNEATATETVNGVTVKVHSNGHKFYDIANKSAIDSSFNSLGTAWYYGVDTANECVFLPRSNYVTSYVANGNKSVSVKGNGKTLGLWNGSTLYSLYGGSGQHDFRPGKYSATIDSSATSGNITVAGRFGLTTDASKSGITGTVNITNSQTGMYLYICVGNTVADTSWVDVVTQVKGGVKDLEDKTNEGIERLRQSSTALTQAQITNCLLEVPQNIKLELADGVLTLKKGSKVIVPNGAGVFDEVEINSDLTYGGSSVNWSNTKWLVYRPNGTLFVNNGDYTSGSTYTGGTYGLWYDTTNNSVKYTSNGGSTWVSGYSLPLAQITVTSGIGVISINQVFNGFGYIGSTIWVDKGVKGLIPNGRNEDGALSNIEFITSQVVFSDRAVLNGENRGFFFNIALNKLQDKTYSVDKKNIADSGAFVYNPEINNIYDSGGTGSRYVLCGYYSSTDGKITSLQPKQPFRAIDYSDSSTISGSGMPSNKYVNLTFGATGTKYTAPANGWFGLTWWTTATATTYLRLHNITSGLGMLLVPNQGSAYEQELFVPVKKGDVVGLYYGNVESASSTAHTKYFRFIYAQGEV